MVDNGRERGLSVTQLNFFQCDHCSHIYADGDGIGKHSAQRMPVGAILPASMLGQHENVLHKAEKKGGKRMPQMKEITSGLRFPEGPVAMDDGSVLVVEIARGTLTRVRPNGAKEVVAETLQ